MAAGQIISLMLGVADELNVGVPVGKMPDQMPQVLRGFGVKVAPGSGIAAAEKTYAA